MRDDLDCLAFGQSLDRSVLNTFELMCFSAAEPVAQSAGILEHPISRKIDFHGDAEGGLCLAMGRETARFLASYFYGEDAPSLHESHVESLVTELTNVVCGGMLSLFAPSGNFSLSTPRPYPFQRYAPGTLERSFHLEAGAVMVSVSGPQV